MNSPASTDPMPKSDGACQSVRNSGCAPATSSCNGDCTVIGTPALDGPNEESRPYDQREAQYPLERMWRRNANNPTAAEDIEREIAITRRHRKDDCV